MLEGAEVRLAVDIGGTFTDIVLDVGQDRRTRIDDGTTIFHYPNDLYQTDSVSGLPTKHGMQRCALRGCSYR